MLIRKWSKLRRRDNASHRYFQQKCGVGRTQSIRRGTVVPTGSSVRVEKSRPGIRSSARHAESKMILRLDGDSVAYFLALEAETALSHQTLRQHWQELANAFATSPWI